MNCLWDKNQSLLTMQEANMQTNTWGLPINQLSWNPRTTPGSTQINSHMITLYWEMSCDDGIVFGPGCICLHNWHLIWFNLHRVAPVRGKSCLWKCHLIGLTALHFWLLDEIYVQDEDCGCTCRNGTICLKHTNNKQQQTNFTWYWAPHWCP